MNLACIVHYITVELSDGLVHMFQVQRKGSGLALISHTLQSEAPGKLTATRRARLHQSWQSPGGHTGIRVMSFNIWNYNGNWMARARMIADVIESSGAGVFLGRMKIYFLIY